MKDTKHLPYGTKVRVTISKELDPIKSIIVGLGSANIDPVLGPLHIVKCIDGYLPNSIYPYDTFVAPLGIIDIDPYENDD
jgi:hypothetical protein